jgi:hypothetical protein
MEGIDAVRCKVLRPTDAGVSHDRDAAAWFIRRGGGSIAASATANGAIEGVIRAPLVAHLVRDVINGERIAHRIR